MLVVLWLAEACVDLALKHSKLELVDFLWKGLVHEQSGATWDSQLCNQNWLTDAAIDTLHQMVVV